MRSMGTRFTRAAAATVAALLGLSAPSWAQAHPRAAPVDSLRRIQVVEPLSGPPGTTVRIHTENMPLQARIHVGVGKIGAGFEVIGEGSQEEWGIIDATVRLPDLSWDRPVYLIMLNAIFSPIGLSDPFHVTDAHGRVQRTGTVAAAGASCLTLTDDEHVVYAIAGTTAHGLQVGDLATVQGVYRDAGGCAGGRAIEVGNVVEVRR